MNFESENKIRDLGSYKKFLPKIRVFRHLLDLGITIQEFELFCEDIKNNNLSQIELWRIRFFEANGQICWTSDLDFDIPFAYVWLAFCATIRNGKDMVRWLNLNGSQILESFLIQTI